jgi:single-stranded-DNA-specific exonuclease
VHRQPEPAGLRVSLQAIAGVGVMFYVMLALRAELRRRGRLRRTSQPNLGVLTDLVALGTVADVVPLDANNRILVAQGLKRLRSGFGNPGLVALLRSAGRFPAEANCFDLGFILGPAAQCRRTACRHEPGIEGLITDDEGTAANCAQELDRLNRERRRIEGGMLEGAVAALDALVEPPGATVTLFEAGWHQG